MGKYVHIRKKPNAPHAVSKQDMPTTDKPATTCCWAALSSSFGQSGGAFITSHTLVVKEALMLATAAELILTRQGSAVGVGVEDATTAHVLPPDQVTPKGTSKVVNEIDFRCGFLDSEVDGPPCGVADHLMAIPFGKEDLVATLPSQVPGQPPPTLPGEPCIKVFVYKVRIVAGPVCPLHFVVGEARVVVLGIVVHAPYGVGDVRGEKVRALGIPEDKDDGEPGGERIRFVARESKVHYQHARSGSVQVDDSPDAGSEEPTCLCREEAHGRYETVKDRSTVCTANSGDGDLVLLYVHHKLQQWRACARGMSYHYAVLCHDLDIAERAAAAAKEWLWKSEIYQLQAIWMHKAWGGDGLGWCLAGRENEEEALLEKIYHEILQVPQVD
ncbi:hypothetical protein V492_07596 [Pseudogymnoascus sp. VKM F-4246]|nr:hypothetical protein V492_07596 [Pseudogymnoascus sp. VKM F-4246]